MKQTIQTQEAPQAIGPYSQGVAANGFLFVSGQIPIDPATGNLVEGDIEAQTERVLRNLAAIVAAAGSAMDRVVRTTVYLKDMGEFARMNAVYARFFPSQPPARSTVEVARLPRDVKVEMDLVALVG